jgi:glycine/D-amino acid oxidase-like deaminating enzyme
MRKAPQTVCVVGGGFTGAAAAIACLARIDAPFRLVVV